MDRKDVFRIRLNCVDHAQYAPNTLDTPIWGPRSLSATQRIQLPDVPVIRVWGATETGQKACVHIHGAFPYLYIPYTESIEEDHVNQYMSNIRHSIDHAMCLSYRRNPYENPRNATFVAHISLVKGVPFFGYNVGYKYYLKIYLLNPLHMTRISDLLQQGAILRQHFQPYEAHLQYLLQWMCDFNLYGCAYIEVAKVQFRRPIPAWEELDDLAHLWHDRSIDAKSVLDEERFPRQSHCQLELDIRVEDILNREVIQPRPLHHSFIERLASLENLPPEEKLVHSMAGLWKDETRRRKMRMGLTDPSSSPFPPEVLVSMSADPRNDSKGGWIHEEEFREAIAELAEQEKKQRGGAPLSFEAFGSQKNDHDDGVQTVLQSVSELFHSTLEKKWEKLAQEAKAREQEPYEMSFEDFMGTQRPPGQAAVVDESSIAQLGEDEGYLSDEEAAKEFALTQHQKLKDAKLDTMGEAKVAGTTAQLEAQAERLEGATVTQSTIERTQKSLLKRPAPNGSQVPFKKVRLEGPDTSPRVKYRRFRVKDIKHTAFVEGASSRPGGDGFEAPPAAQARKELPLDDSVAGVPPSAQPPSSQRSLQSSQGDQIAFPTVKYPHDPATTLRLSQRSDLAHIPQRASQLSQKDALVSSNGSSTSKTIASLSSLAPESRAISVEAANTYAHAFKVNRSLLIAPLPPTFDEVTATTEPSVIYQDAYYSNEKDVPERVREYAGQEFRLESTTLPYLPVFEKSGLVGQPERQSKVDAEFALNRRRWQCSLKVWEITRTPPSFCEVEEWMKTQKPLEPDELDILDVDGPPAASQLKRKNKPPPELSQIEGPTQRNKHGFKYSQHKASTSVQHETGYMSTMSLEVHVNSRADLAPDPERDEVNLVVWCIVDEQMDEQTKLGILVLIKDDEDLPAKIRKVVGNDVQIDSEDNELDLINRMVDIVREFDIDILTGYEVHNNSWGYLIERARLQYEFNLPDEFSRMKSHSKGRFGKDADRWGFTHTSTVSITGRHTINIWRAMRSELNLLQYTMENVVFHLLHRRIPHYTYATLTRWYKSDRPRDFAKLLDYLVTRTKLDLEILDANELIPRTSEQARLLGVDFFSVFSRGSQFKVESLMFRIAKPESFVLVSPSRKQVGAQNALECLPLVMEPQSAFYSSPLLVLDFQSLYPSVMIAYNLCYSTCLGRITNWRGTNKMGFADFKRHPGLLELTKDKLNIAPNGMMYVKPEMRKSLLAKMLGEILETRVMVKSGMKVDKDDKTLQQLLNNRQLALKLIANVTYGYTSASFSGRMPCSEIADSIVQTGRETLEKAIALIHSVERWGAEVVYGDTDSLFVYLKGRTKDDAFRIGDEIAKAVTDMNPRPVKLKFEKVYHPCVLLAKKRYVGFKYESPSQKEPDFDAKGIETVRRDGTPAEQKMEEKALKLLFRTADLSQVKSYFQAQCTKILTGRFSVQDFCFAKEVKLGTYADKGPPPPGALIATRRMLKDPRQEPQYGERVPYVVIAGAPGARLWERCVEPEQLIRDENAELDAEYYINKNLIPPLERIFNLVGANVRSWWDELPKVQRIRQLGGVQQENASGAKNMRKTMESYMGSSLCLVCRTKLTPPKPTSRFAVPEVPVEMPLPLCSICRHVKTSSTLVVLRRKLQAAEAKATSMHDVCRSCAGIAFDEEVRCDSRDCPVFYSRVKADTQLRVAKRGVETVLEALEEEVSQREDLEW
ncbi:Putative DNA-directed DNA polymerase, family B, exonuclease domain, ribonuclease H-like superfamily [Septoria linicola]|uniref:DNA polymerase n=1 Tax=Septoria linicola TaxID=215465 RepID=A0A9Q9EIL4_9PEZI|nr:putative DNA-directed DNA polymerase, family B, exonuclease domain, ribonuclease H-like superfamily [Septoria linicola]USW50478.1 Putative DNA-directed DNA polymerase, family B, exonuclease domain, ribonuclease H-like superfamily [Septoria linicola]